jgi:long-chain fatty acid transport protein
MRLRKGYAALALSAALLFLCPERARAGGFFLTDRGVLPLGRAGAFVAGARGIESLWYNPAGLAGTGRSLRIEGMVTLLDASFTRIDDGGTVRPTVTVEAPFLPIPLLGYSDDFGLEDWDFALALFAPNAQPYRWPDSVDGKAAPQRYSLIATDKSLIVHLAGGAAYSGIKNLSVGADVQLITGRFYTETVFTACDMFACAFPEDPEFDSRSVVDLEPFFTFTAALGATYQFPYVKIGVSGHTPYNIGGDAKLKAGLPTHPVFDDARIEGDQVELKVPFAGIARAGIEISPMEELRIEISGVREGWSRQTAIDVTPKDVWMRNVTGVGDYEVGRIRLDRQMQDVWSARLGGEYTFDRPSIGLRAGAAYETGAFKDATLSPITLDSDKLLLAAGASIGLPFGLSIDVSFAHVFLRDRKVRTSTIEQPTALRPAPEDGSHIANGDYVMEANVIGVGLTYQRTTAHTR